MSWWEQLDGPVLGRYRIERLLGEGGMARVFLATDVKAGRAVAFKTPKIESFPPDRVDELLARFNREFRSQASDPIQGVIPIYESGEFTDAAGTTRPFLAMQYLSGGSLADKLGGQVGRREHRQTLGEVLDWLVPIARTLDRLHARKYLHRDVKPDNILFNTDGDPFLADFGIVGTLDEALNGSTLGIVATGLMGSPGSPGYQSPESIQADPSLRNVSSSDQFSLAVTVYEALAGVLPARAGTSQEWYGALMHWAPTPLSEPAPELPPAAVSAVMKAMSRQPRERFASCSEFAKALSAAATASAAARALPAAPVVPTPQPAAPKPAGNTRPWIRVVMVLVLLAGGIAGWEWWQRSRVQAERDRRADAILAAVPKDASASERVRAWKESVDVRHGNTPAPAPAQSAPAGSSSFVNDLATEIVDDANKARQDAAAAASSEPRELLAIVFFDFDKSSLRPDGMATLDALVERLRKHPSLKATIEGHANLVDGERAGAARAQAVYDYLVKQGVAGSRLGTPVDRKTSRPTADFDSPEGRIRNRSVEVFAVPVDPVAILPFDADSAVLAADVEAKLDGVIESLRANGDLRLRIAGHASSEDPSGAGGRRAQAVRDYLVSQGVDASRMDTVDFGGSRPLVGNDSSNGRARNRRVEVFLLD